MIYVKYAGAKIYEYYVCSMQHVLGTFGPWGGCGVVTAGVPSRLLDWTLRSFQHRTSTPPTTHFAKLITLDGLSIGIAPWKTRAGLAYVMRHMSNIDCFGMCRLYRTTYNIINKLYVYIYNAISNISKIV